MTTNKLSGERGGPLQRLSSNLVSTAQSIFQTAMWVLVPDDQTQRKAFEALMPFLYVLRNKGCSWPQLTKLLTDSGFSLQPSTVRSYYSEMLATRQDICQERMNEQILLLAEVRKETKSINVASVSQRVATIMATQQAKDSAKLDSMFGTAQGIPGVINSPGATPTPSTITRSQNVRSEIATQDQNKKTGLRPAPLKQDDELPVSVKTSISVSELKTTEQIQYICNDLPRGLKPLKPREGLQAAFYLDGKLEHPAVVGVLLTLEQRLSSIALEFKNIESNEVRIENQEEKRFRILWKKRIPITESSTSDNFTAIDHSLFK